MLTVGVEEEFHLVDGAGIVVPKAAPVLARLPGANFRDELLSTQVEAVTDVCESLSELRRELGEHRSQLLGAARAEGVIPLATGTPVLTGPDPAFSEGERFARIADMYRGVVRDYQCCGCHVHVGVPDQETAVAVVNHVRPWLPMLLAISGNSPYSHGRDTGHESWRMLEQARFPGSGVPPYFRSAADYEHRLGRLVDSGVLVDERMTFWLVRPSPRYPTVEFRVADTAATVDDAVLQAGLTRALVATALDDLAAGRAAPQVDHQVLAAAVWSAARYGLEGPAVHPFKERAVPAAELLTELIDRLRPALERNGDLTEITTLLALLRRHGTGAARQRRARPAGFPAVLALLAAQTAKGTS